MAAARKRRAAQPRIVVAVTGSVGAVAVPYLLVALRRTLGCGTRVVLTQSAQRFLTADTARALSGTPPTLEFKAQPTDDIVPHLDLTADADLLLVYPATANILGKAACGIADDIVSTTILVAACPVVFVPSMNEVMWANPIVRSNVERLRQHGYEVMPPGEGVEVATMEMSTACAAPLGDVLARVDALITGRPQTGRAAAVSGQRRRQHRRRRETVDGDGSRKSIPRMTRPLR